MTPILLAELYAWRVVIVLVDTTDWYGLDALTVAVWGTDQYSAAGWPAC